MILSNSASEGTPQVCERRLEGCLKMKLSAKLVTSQWQYLRKEKKFPMCTAVKSEQGWKKCSRHWNGDFPAAHGENHTEADHYAVAHWGMLCWEQVETPRRKLQRQIPGPCEGTNTKLVCSWRTTTWRETTLQHFPKYYSPLETDHLSSSQLYHFMEGTLHWSTVQRGSSDRSDELTGNLPFLSALHHSWQRSRRIRSEGVKAESVKKWKIGKGVFMFLTMLLKVARNLPKPALFLPMMLISKWSACLHREPQTFLSYFLPSLYYGRDMRATGSQVQPLTSTGL